MPDAPELRNLLVDLWADLHDVNVLWQAGVLASALAAGWLVQQLVEHRAAQQQASGLEDAHRLRTGSFRRLAFPLTALLLVLIGRAILQHWRPVNLLNVAVPMLFALALVRITIYVLRQVFAPDGWLRSSERYLAWIVWLGVVVYIGGLWPALHSTLHDIGFSLGQQRISLLVVVQALLSVSITVLLALWLGRVVESRVMRVSAVNVSLRVMITKLAQTLLLLLAILIALPAVGIDLTVLSVFGGMLGVGIGFGLQKIASNYISGFIILMDRSVSIGDLVTVDKFSGQLTKMTARYVVVRALDGTEAIIPNEFMIATPVVNHSYTDRRVRVGVRVQVSYRSDLEQVSRILVDVGLAHPRVLKEPAPTMLVLEFADSGINVELGVWIEDLDKGSGGLRSELYLEMWRRFREHGIEIPYPQREVRILGSAGDAPN